MNIPPWVDIIISVIVKECDDIYNIGYNECFKFVTIL